MHDRDDTAGRADDEREPRRAFHQLWRQAVLKESLSGLSRERQPCAPAAARQLAVAVVKNQRDRTASDATLPRSTTRVLAAEVQKGLLHDTHPPFR